MGGGGRRRHNTDLYYDLAQCNVPEEHNGRGNPEEAQAEGGQGRLPGGEDQSAGRKEDWAVAGHSEHECDGCFNGSEGCREPEEGEFPPSHDG